MLQFLKRFIGKYYGILLSKSDINFADFCSRKHAPNSANWGGNYLSHLTHWPAACLKGFARVRLGCALMFAAQSIDFSLIIEGASWNRQGATQ